ncbi:MAG: hypothetical protein ACR2OI_12915 [Acidimicrobiia bacterium]
MTNDAVVQADERVSQLQAEGVLTEESSPQEVKDGLTRILEEVRIPLQQAADAMDPPEQVADLHTRLWSWHAELINIETTLVRRVGETPDTDEGWASFSDSPEVAAYRASIAAGKQLCNDLQTQLDDTEARGAFKDVPWVPTELSEVVDAALGCEGFPDDPQSIYRYPSP